LRASLVFLFFLFFLACVPTAALIHPTAALAATPSADPAVLVDDAEVLDLAESRGLDFATVIGAALPARADNKALYGASATYRDIVDTVAADLHLAGLADKRASVTMAGSHRLFDQRWLKSSKARFELAAVVNRLDRRPFQPKACGETRLVYRLRYAVPKEGELLTSRLPMTVNAVFWQSPDESGKCRSAAERWTAARAAAKDPKALLDSLTAETGPLHASRLMGASRKSLETNLQSVRWPSTTRPDLGAHAEYMLRAFVPTTARGRVTWEPGPLENTPDVKRLAADPALRAKLLAWLKDPENLARVDRGVAVLPDAFLARRVSSFSPRGLTRAANRPFSRLFTAADFEAAALAKNRFATSPEALLRRLDDLSCAGCHQARTVAGFHLLGIDRKDTTDVNFVNVTGSPHLLGDLARRRAFVDAVAAGKDPLDDRALSERTETGPGGYGAHCGLGDPGFSAWTCGEGLTCQSVGNAASDRTVGQCFPPALGKVGDPCELGTMIPHDDPTKDRVTGAVAGGCRDGGVCYVNYGGFPEGMCGVSCDAGAKNAACGGIAILKDFNGCLAKGGGFARCIRENVDPLGLRACGNDDPCRDDYLCVRTSTSAGACIPPYFLFQMRVDGHPRPPP
jgi:hypothetical protein